MEYSVDDLQWSGTREGQAIGTGRYERTTNGRTKEIMVFKEWISTVGAGRIEMEEWFRLMDEAIAREGREKEIAAMEKDAKRLAWLRTEKDVHRYALESIGILGLRKKYEQAV